MGKIVRQFMRTEKKVKKELDEAMERYKDWCDRVDKKEILWRNTEKEIDELDKDFKREIIMPLVTELVGFKFRINN